MSPAAVTARLRAALQASKARTVVPMDPASVSARLRSVSELRDLCIELAKGRITPVDANRRDD